MDLDVEFIDIPPMKGQRNVRVFLPCTSSGTANHGPLFERLSCLGGASRVKR
jgi:hypothetical protein